MSLLMDALKKAELAKRQGQSEGAGDAAEADARDGLALEPLGGSAAAPTASAADSGLSTGNLPQLPAHLEELDAQFLAEAKQAASARPRTQPSLALAGEQPADKPAEEQLPRTTAAGRPRRTRSEPAAPQSRSEAQNLFAAKQADKPPARKTFGIAVGVFTVLAVCAIGGYFWWQLQPKSAFVASRAPQSPPPVATPAAVPPTVAASPAPAPATPPVAAVAGGPGTVPQAVPLAEHKADDSVPAVAKAPVQSRRATSTAAAATETEGPVHVTRAPLKVNPVLIRGFDAFNRGDLALAQTEYERAQKSDPHNTDVLHGLAAIAVRQGRLDQAEELYRQITIADPQDTVAMAALINSRTQVEPSAAESRLKTMSAAQPELAAPYFSLGNLYARHGRWNEAQQAYFRAYSAEPDNPDIMYNLAISLEHLRQNKLAAQYYGQAIAAAQNRPAGFDKAQATARLRTLQP